MEKASEVSCERVEKELEELGRSSAETLLGTACCEGAELMVLDSGNTSVTRASSCTFLTVLAACSMLPDCSLPYLLLLEQIGPAFAGLPLPRRLFANPEVLAAGQQGLEVDSPGHHIRVSLQQALVQNAQVRVACHECNCHDGVYGMRARLLGDGEKNGGDMAVVPARARLLRVAGRLPAASKVSEHLGALKLIQWGGRVAFYRVVGMGVTPKGGCAR
jgi:hypothetical protein